MNPSPRCIEGRVATQHILRKQHLSDNFQALSVQKAVNNIIALHATSAATPYISLLARVKNFKKQNLDTALYKERSLVRLRAMRNTLFITSTELAPMLYQATKPKLLKGIDRLISPRGIPRAEYDELAERIKNILNGGRKTSAEIKKAIPKEVMRTVELKDGRFTYRMTNINLVLNAMIRQGIVVSEKEEGTVRTTEANHYILFEKIYPRLNLESGGTEEAKRLLIERYIKAFGPVTADDIAWWTGFNKTHVITALTTLEKKLLSVPITDFKGEYLMLETDYEQCAKSKPTRTRSVLLLPYEDPYTKGYKIRDRLVDIEHEKDAYVGGGVQPTVLVDGKIVGTWDKEALERKEQMKLHFFKQPAKEVEKIAVHKAKTIGKLMTDRKVKVEIT